MSTVLSAAVAGVALSVSQSGKGGKSTAAAAASGRECLQVTAVPSATG